MKILKALLLVSGVAALSLIVPVTANAATAEVKKNGNNYTATLNGKTTNSSDLATAINTAIGSGNNTVNISCGGNLSKTVNLQSGTSLNFNSNETIIATTGSAVAFKAKNKNNVSINGLKLTGKAGMGIRFSGCNNTSVTNSNLSGSGIGIGIRIDTNESNPWNYSHNRGCTVKNITMSNLSDMGVETYSIDNYDIDNITGTKLGSCVVLINDGKNGKIGTVTGTDCCVDGGYAALRFANDCDGATVKKVNATHCGRGFFTCTNSSNITVESVDIKNCIRNGILLENGRNNVVKSGTVTGCSIVIKNSPGSSTAGVTKR
jgi:hypothetical protein